MDATISLHTFGRRNNWFSSLASFKLILLLLGAAIFGSFGFLMFSHRQSIEPVEGSLAHLRAMSNLVQQMTSARLQVEHFLATGDSNSYAAAEQALVQAVDALEQSMTQPDYYFILSKLEQTSTDYLNTFRSLGNVIMSGAPASTQDIIRQRLDEAALKLDQQGNEALQANMAAIDTTLGALSASMTSRGIELLLALGFLLSISLGLTLAIINQSGYTLHQIAQAARQIAQGQYDTRIDLTGESNPDILQLGEAFNGMVETIKIATQSESAAYQQNKLQIMKLARQERITAILEERQRIARELHDSVKQQLFSITLSAEAGINLLEQAPRLVKTYLEHIRQAGHNAQAEMTALIQELVPISLQEQRLEDALLGYLQPLCETHGLKLLWRTDGTNTLTIAQEHALLRAVQEAVSNVVRHSEATVVRVSLNFGLVTYVIVEDNGEGFVPEAVSVTSTGLALMRTRLKRVGGCCELQTTPGMGTRLTIVMDLRRTARLRA